MTERMARLLTQKLDVDRRRVAAERHGGLPALVAELAEKGRRIQALIVMVENEERRTAPREGE